ncbi:hypothetical protein EAO05_00925 [Klebsiella pneumoniae]|nr:hypothetical protein EAO05_00925 [Klebsiella pneumoniae]
MQLVSELAGTGPAKAREESNPYESLLVSLNRAVRRAAYPMSISLSPSPLKCCRRRLVCATADRVWVRHHLKVVRYSLDNVSLSPAWCVKAISGSPEHVPSCSVPRRAC